MNQSLLPLLKKYDIPAPRYTSYPTVPAWTEQVKATDYQSSIATLKAGENLSLYFHLPFCEKLCHFCGCMRVITTDHERSAPYVQKILEELKLALKLIPKNKRRVSQIHFGGGTPNFLQPKELAQIMTTLRDQFEILPEAEIAIEMHPRTSTQAFCDMLKELAFNRISLGVQDFDPRVQELIHRFQTHEMTEAMIKYLRNLGFRSFNFDLIYGLPGQNLETWLETFKKVIELKPNRLAVYSYAHVPWKSPVQRSFKEEDLPAPELKLELFEAAYHQLTQNGYLSIGMDHFALAEDELSLALKNGSIHRNFMGYSTRADAHQFGFGVSAISYVGGNYFQNLKDLSNYERCIQDANLATFRGFLLSQEDAMRRDLITTIMCRGQIDFSTFEKKWSLNFQDRFETELKNLSLLQKDGLVEVDDTKIRATALGFLFLRIIAKEFDPYLQKIRQQSQNPTFSRTV